MSVSFDGTETYGDLLQLGQPHSISSGDEAIKIQEQIDTLLDKGQLTVDEEEYLSLLGDLVLAWENTTVVWPRLTPRQVIRELMNVNGYTQRNLVGSVFPTTSVTSEVLSGKRGVTYEHVQKLARFFHVSPAAFFDDVGDSR